MYTQTHRLILAILFVLFYGSCQEKEQEEVPDQAGFSLDFPAISDKLLERMDIQAGERVILMGLPGDFDALIPLLQKGISAAGAEYLGALSMGDIQPESWATDFTRGAEGKDLTTLTEYFQAVDLGIMLPGATVTHTPYKAMQDVLKGNSGRTLHFHWAGAYDLSGQELPRDDTIDAFYQKALLATDYLQLAERQQQFEAAMRGKRVNVRTPAGTDISFEIGERPVTKQDGNASAARAAAGKNLIDREVELPAGAIRVAPIEESVEGTIVFPRMQWNGEWVDGLSMNFEKGRLVDFTAAHNSEAVEAELAQAGEAGRSFREFALGLNPDLAIQRSGRAWMPYYGYGAGVVRLSLGDNTELGGQVGGDYVRWNFFPDASVKVGEDLWVKDGELLKP